MFLDLPDAVFRGYEGDDQLLGPVRADDDAPIAILRREIARLEPQAVYVPLGDRQPRRPPAVPRRRRLAPRRAAELGHARSRRGPARSCSTRTSRTPGGAASSRSTTCPQGALAGIPDDVLLTPRYADISDQLERKVRGIAMYESQLDRLFGGDEGDGDAASGSTPPPWRRSAGSTAPPSATGTATGRRSRGPRRAGPPPAQVAARLPAVARAAVGVAPGPCPGPNSGSPGPGPISGKSRGPPAALPLARDPARLPVAGGEGRIPANLLHTQPRHRLRAVSGLVHAQHHIGFLTSVLLTLIWREIPDMFARGADLAGSAAGPDR